MNKGRLIKSVQRDTKLSKADAKAAVESVIANLKTALKETAKVTLEGTITVQAVLPCPQCGTLVRSNRLEKHKKKCLNSQESKIEAENNAQTLETTRKVAESSKQASKPKYIKKKKYKPRELETIFEKGKRASRSTGSKKSN